METNINGKELNKKKEVRHWWSKPTHLTLIKKKAQTCTCFLLFLSQEQMMHCSLHFLLLLRGRHVAY